MKKMQKNNKGFSLVELIVVILIMAIIAVALAPQVMKWVDSSRVSTDNNNRATLKNAVDAAVADYMSDNKKLDQTNGSKYRVKGITVTADGTASTEDTALIPYITEVLNKQPLDVKTDNNGYFEVSVDKLGSVTVVVRGASGEDLLSGKDV